MSGFMVEYMGRHVPKDTFRAFVYSKDGEQKLVNSWDEFQIAIATGDWFDDLVSHESGEKSKKTKKTKEEA